MEAGDSEKSGSQCIGTARRHLSSATKISAARKTMALPISGSAYLGSEEFCPTMVSRGMQPRMRFATSRTRRPRGEDDAA